MNPPIPQYSISRLYWWKVVTRFTGNGDIGKKPVSYIKTVPWINITTEKYVIKSNIFKLNKPLRKSAWLFEKRNKIKITLPFSTCVLVAVWCAETSYYAVWRFSMAAQLAQCWPAIITNNSNNLYSHDNNECICKVQNKSCWHRKFSVSVVMLCSHKSGRCAVELYHAPHLWYPPFYTSPMASSALQHWTVSPTKEGYHWQAGGENRQTWQLANPARHT